MKRKKTKLKRTVLYLFVVFIMFLVAGCSNDEDGVHEISVQDLEDILDENYQFVDIRTESEYLGETGPLHIDEFTINIDYYQFKFDDNLLNDLDVNTPIVIICNSGNRSGSAVNLLKDYGFTEIYDVQGGITAWYSK